MAGHLLAQRDGSAEDALSRCHGIELEASRARALAERLGADRAHHGDAFHFTWSEGDGVSLLYLNPPYDVDREYGRLEQRFLARFTGLVAPGGALVFVVPHYALLASAAYLASHYRAITVRRFPDPDYAGFRQVVLTALKRATPSHPDPELVAQLQAAAAGVDHLEILGAPIARPLQLEPHTPDLSLRAQAVDLASVLAHAKPFSVQPTLFGYDRNAAQLLGAPMPVALPARPAHIALALASGLLNGRRLEPNDPSRFPTLLAKGTFTRDLITVERRFTKDGDHTGDVKVQRPRLDMRVLRLDNRTFHTLRLGTEPSEAQDIADFNTADLLVEYSEALARLVREQLPALHDPANPDHQIRLPAFAREPFKIQSAAIQAGLKLIAQGETPQCIAEVGTGKTTVALNIVRCLAPENLPLVRSELRRQGLPVERLRAVRRALVVCPPHLLDGWSDQAAAVLPGARVQIVNTPSDLDQEAEIYILSRETAKLGSGIAGVAGDRCPRCSQLLEISSGTIRAEARARCSEPVTVPAPGLTAVTRLLALKAYPYLEPAARQQAARLLIEHPAAFHQASKPIDALPADRLDLLLLEAPLAAVVDEQLQRNDWWVAEATAAFTAAARLAVHLRRVDHLRARLQTGRASDHALQILNRELAEPRPSTSVLLHRLFGGLLEAATWSERKGCSEPLHWMTANPRRYALARYILRRKRRLFDFLILDEVHEFATTGSAQAKAAHRLVELKGVPTLALSGSIMGGYASSLFANAWALSRDIRTTFDRTDKAAFVTRYGYRKIFVSASSSSTRDNARLFGSRTDREADPSAPEIRQLGEAPGILPLYVLEHVLPTGLIMHKGDLDDALPPLTEEPTAITPDPRDPFDALLLKEFARLRSLLLGQIARDRHTPKAGLLFGALSELPSYLDLAAEECGPFEIAYPEHAGGDVLAEGHLFPSSWRSPKERWLLSTVRSQLAAGRQVLVFLRHTGSDAFIRRLLRLLLEELGEPAVFLDPSRVTTKKRQRWIDQHVLAAGRRVLLVHPKAVETGLNNLVAFGTGIWYEGPDMNARTTRQANGRLHRIGQANDVRLLFPYYDGTLQKTALDLVARKITASLQVDGLSIEGALEAAGASSADDREHAAAALAFGQALYSAAAAENARSR